MLHRRIKTVLVVAAALFSFGMLDTAHVMAQVMETPRFVIRHEGTNRLYAKLVADYAERAYDRIDTLLGRNGDNRINIFIAPDEADFRELTGGRLPDWSAAVAIGRDTIILSPLEGHKQELGHVIAHELAHVFINDLTGDLPVPRWFHEGVAEMVSGSLGIQGRINLMVRTAQNNLLSFRNIQDIFSSGQSDATLAYDQSMLAVRRLTELHGQGVIGSILNRTRETGSFDQAFADMTGITVVEFEADYLKELRERFGYAALVTSLVNTWTIILVIAVFAFIIQRIRTRRIIRRWEEEEKHPGMTHFPDEPDFDE